MRMRIEDRDPSDSSDEDKDLLDAIKKEEQAEHPDKARENALRETLRKKQKERAKDNR